MRGSTWIVGILFLVACLSVLAGRFLPSISNVVAEQMGTKGIGKAVVPKHLDERMIRGRAEKSNRAESGSIRGH